ncbi:YciI family protein [Haloferula sp. BvORR071]|uniref:YciI family protein n=1 Tax=Haloferula sp. BvORR071 TaxID=1396141 RepID=UPI000553A1DD|nr:YciI family protein [Haloferula sp. BvORR071]
MKFLMLMIPHGYQPGTPPEERIGEDFIPKGEDLEKMKKMGQFNDDLAKAAKILDIDGLAPLTKGARVSFKGGSPSVTDGPFIESKEVIGGYWLFEIGSREEAIEWARRVPAEPGDVVELRPIFEFPEGTFAE